MGSSKKGYYTGLCIEVLTIAHVPCASGGLIARNKSDAEIAKEELSGGVCCLDTE